MATPSSRLICAMAAAGDHVKTFHRKPYLWRAGTTIYYQVSIVFLHFQSHGQSLVWRLLPRSVVPGRH